MLANGATLGYKTSGTTYTLLTGLKEIPDMGVEPEKVENTVLGDSTKKYENGIGDPGDMTYKFKYDNSSSTASYRVLKGLEANHTVVDWEETTADGTKTRFSGQVSVKRVGGGVNAAVEFEASISLASDLAIVNPISSRKEIETFVIGSSIGVINETNHTVAVEVPHGTSVTSLTPTITISDDATISPASGVAKNFTSPQTYTVTAEDTTTQAYVVTVTVAEE